jgi:hypothetical protein
MSRRLQNAHKQLQHLDALHIDALRENLVQRFSFEHDIDYGYTGCGVFKNQRKFIIDALENPILFW